MIVPAQISAVLPNSVRAPGEARQGKADALAVPLPRISPWLLGWFRWYTRRHLARHFHSVRLASDSTRPWEIGGPLVIYANHASWWDPMVLIALADLRFPGTSGYAPMDQQALQRYPFFKKLGLFGVDQTSPSGARQFLRTATAILRGSPRASSSVSVPAVGSLSSEALAKEDGLSAFGSSRPILWITPQGRFADARERPARFRPGLAHLAMRCPEATFVPLAIEYTFWEEKLPEVLLRFGQPLSAHEASAQSLEAGLAETQDLLATQATARATEKFETLIAGSAGASRTYDLWRRIKALSPARPLIPRTAPK